MKRLGGVLVLLGMLGISQAASNSFLAPVGLQAEWTFAEGSGLMAGDSSGNDLTATLQKGATWSSARIGSGVVFDGTNDFINLGDSRGLVQNVPAATVALWIKPSTIIPAGAFRELISLSVGSANPTNTSRIAFSLKGDGTTAGDLFAGGRSTDNETQKTLQTDSNLAIGSWTHVVAVVNFATNTIQVFKDGALLDTNAAAGFAQAATANTPSRSCTLGAQDAGDSNYYHGAMDEVRVYNRALAPLEIQTLASGANLRAHWNLDEAAGLTANDASGNAHTGTLKNGLDAGWVAGQVSGALRFDGVDDYVQVDAPGLLRNVNAATVAAWIKPSATLASGAFREIISISVGGNPSDVSRVALALRGDGTAGDVFLGGRSSDAETQKSAVADVSLSTGVYTHVAGVVNYAQGTLDIYINGHLAQSAPVAFTQPFSSNTASASIALGAQDTGGSNRFLGDIDEIRVYARALTACDIQELAGRDGLQAYWRFDEAAGTAAADSSGTGLTATLKNGATFAPGRVGNALQLDGVDDYADLGLNLPILKSSNAATVAAWINLDSLPASGSFREIVSIAVGGTPSNVSRLAFAVKGDGAAADLYVGGRSTDNDTQQSLTADANIQAGAWRHVAATLDFGQNQIRIYLDGALLATGPATFAQPLTAVTPPANGALGAQDLGDSNFNHAKLDEVRIYCRVLSAAEIASLASSAAPAAPALSLVEQGNQQAKLSWTSVSGADFYNLKRSLTQGSGYTTIATVGNTNYTDQGLTNGTPYYYVVSAQNASGESANSNEVIATPVGGVPPAPSISSPITGTVLGTTTPVISGNSSSPGLTITVLVDGVPNSATTSGVAGNWSLTLAVPLISGTRSLTATATSPSGTSPKSAAVLVTTGTAGPSIVISITPENPAVAQKVISVTFSDIGGGINPSSRKIIIDGADRTSAGTFTGNAWQRTETFSEGIHVVSADATDTLGTRGEATAFLEVSLQPPTGNAELGLSLYTGSPSGRSDTVLWTGSENVISFRISNTGKAVARIATGQTQWPETLRLEIDSVPPGLIPQVHVVVAPAGVRLVPDINAADLWINLKSGQQISQRCILPNPVTLGLAAGDYSVKARIIVPALVPGNPGTPVYTSSTAFKVLAAVGAVDQVDALARRWEVASAVQNKAEALSLAQQIANTGAQFALLGSRLRFRTLSESTIVADVQEAVTILQNILIPQEQPADPSGSLSLDALVEILTARITKLQASVPAPIVQRDLHLANFIPAMHQGQTTTALQEALLAIQQDATFWISRKLAGMSHARLKSYDAALTELNAADAAVRADPAFGQIPQVERLVGELLEQVVALKATE